jgi:hypothetical protein
LSFECAGRDEEPVKLVEMFSIPDKEDLSISIKTATLIYCRWSEKTVQTAKRFEAR